MKAPQNRKTFLCFETRLSSQGYDRKNTRVFDSRASASGASSAACSCGGPTEYSRESRQAISVIASTELQTDLPPTNPGSDAATPTSSTRAGQKGTYHAWTSC